MKKSLLLSALLALPAGATLLSAQSIGATAADTCGATETTRAVAGETIVDIALGDPQFSTLVTALGAADLVTTLQGPGPFTVFAPTDDAFAALPAGTLRNLLKPENKGALTSILTYHVVGDSLDAGAVTSTSGAVSLQGQQIDFEVVVEGTDLEGTTDAAGRFEIRGVPAGMFTVRLLHTGHVPLERKMTFSDGEVTIANLWIRSEAYRDNEVVAIYERKEEEVTRRTLTIEEVKRIPGTFGDPVKVVQTLPGAARSPFGTGLLVIRGSNPEDSGVYIDGIRIPIIYHLTGTTSVISPELIESVDYLPGGYGVQYGRSMGGVVDVKTRSEFRK